MMVERKAASTDLKKAGELAVTKAVLTVELRVPTTAALMVGRKGANTVDSTAAMTAA